MYGRPNVTILQSLIVNWRSLIFDLYSIVDIRSDVSFVRSSDRSFYREWVHGNSAPPPPTRGLKV